jgi:hypothetical protein
MGEMKRVKNFDGKPPKRRDHSEDLGVDGKIILEWMLGKLGAKMWTGFVWLRLGTICGLL